MAQAEKKRIQKPMVGWYDPRQLLDTGVQVLVSDLLGTRADYRVIESFGAPQGVFDYSAEPEIWIDYVADLGDGWNSTYAVASLLAAEELGVQSPDKGTKPIDTKRGRILVMGGDEVYPLASRDGYQERTVGPYECALEESLPPHPNVFAIPGNHDWYDGLVSFSRLFCQERWLGGWKTRQGRSYFAIKLPHRWWLWGVDIQLESDIDEPQLRYFSQIAGRMQLGDRVILATAEPHWIYGNIYDPKLLNNLAFLEKNVIREQAKATLQVAIAGDLHHYRRHESTDGNRTQLITAGGGGAFLHPTYGPPVDEITFGRPTPITYKLKSESEFPDRSTSKRLLLRDLIFPLFNPKFGLLTGLLYLIIAWVLWPSVEKELASLTSNANGWLKAQALLRAILQSPSGLAWIVLVFVGFLFFTDTHKKLYRIFAGSAHAVAHLAGLLLVSWTVGWLTREVFVATRGSLSDILLRAGGLFVGGYLVGCFLMGFYLYVSLRIFRRHANEAFSALHIPDYKNFVRMYIDTSGNLTIFPIGIRRVPRKWQPPASVSKNKPQLIPAGGREIEAALIERPITL